MGYEHILVTLDCSALAELSLRHVSRIASPGARIHLLSVVNSVTLEPAPTEMASVVSSLHWPMVVPAEYKSVNQNISDLHEFNARQDYLFQMAQPLLERGYHVTYETVPGDVIDTIVDTAYEGYDVVVMATHGRTGLRRVLLGSVAEGVLHRAPCPVLLINAHDRRSDN